MYKRRAFLHWYIGEGMDEQEVRKLIASTTSGLIIATVRRSGEQCGGPHVSAFHCDLLHLG